jgi:DNA repair protein RecN (Recombination protein N)
VESPSAEALLERHGLPPSEEGELVLRREVLASGKGKASVNGALVPLSLLRELAPHVGTIHGQHEPLGLLDPDTHLDLVDRHGGLDGSAATVAAAYRELREAEARLARLQGDRRELERRREMLEFQAGEISRAGLAPGEEDALRQERRLLANAERLLSLCDEAYSLLYEDEHAVLGRLGRVFRRVEELAALDPRFASHLSAREVVASQLEDLALVLRDYREGIGARPGRLDEIESRLSQIERLKKKYGATLDEVLSFGLACSQELQGLGSLEERERELLAACDAAAARYLAAARELAAQRRRAAEQLSTRVREELAELAMGGTRFEVRFDPKEPLSRAEDPSTWTERGIERGELQLSPNPGEELRPLARIASGGELSRILLALKSVASLDQAGQTLVFDEVDSGIGGAVAEVVGRKLRRIAAAHQVLCVTHLPQIAALADRHFVVEKRVEGGRTLTAARRLSDDHRVEEVARMLGGRTITDVARRHAREMMAGGRGD